MNELEIKNYELPKLEIKDYEKIKEAVEQDNAKYQKYLVTAYTLDSDVKKRAELRNQAKKIDDRRKEIEKEISVPIKEFKAKCDVLKKMYEESADLIDKQIKVFEEKTKTEKKEEIENLYETIVQSESINELIKFEMIFDERYLNKTFKMKDIEREIKEKVEKIKSGIETLKTLKSEFETELINTYLTDFDITKAIFKNTQLKERQEAMKVAEKKEEKIVEAKVEEMLTSEAKTEEIDPIKTYTLKITAPLSKQKKLREFLELNKMQFERIKEEK